MNTFPEFRSPHLLQEMLQARALALANVRSFFHERGVTEVDSPALSRFASIDPYIDLMETLDGRFLHSSPEYAMKRLLCEGSGDIYFLGHVYRKEELSPLHNAEFTMVEWYRNDIDGDLFLQEVTDLIALFLGHLPIETLDYEEALTRYSKPIEEHSHWSDTVKRDYQWAMNVEPNLGKGKITIITNFLPQDAVLAKTHVVHGKTRARRFELYYEGIELANGFHELSNAKEHRVRFEDSNRRRVLEGRAPYPIDEFFLNALEKRPFGENTYGMAVGFDRLLMLQRGEKNLDTILPFSWERI